MPDIYTHADTLRQYLTGASSDGGTQTNPDNSLGNYASSTQVPGLSFNVTNPITGITISYVSGTNGVGNGTLTAVNSTDLAWTAPGGSQGAAVTVANGATKILEDGTNPSAFIIVTSSAATYTGTATVATTIPTGNVLSMNDANPAETAAGSTRYRAIMAKNVGSVAANNCYAYLGQLGTALVSNGGQLGASGSGTISLSSGSFDTAGWPSSGFCQIQTSGGTLREIVYYSSRTATALTIPSAGRQLLGTTNAAGANTDNIYAVPGIAIGSEAVSSSHIQTIANDTTAPTGITWKTGLNTTNGVSLGNLAAGDKIGLWIKRIVVAGSTANVAVENLITWSFEAG